jgi:hypothetical protein
MAGYKLKRDAARRCPPIAAAAEDDEADDDFTEARRAELRHELGVAIDVPSAPRWRFEHWGTQLAVAFDGSAVFAQRTGRTVVLHFGNLLLGDAKGRAAAAWMRTATVEGKVDVRRVTADAVAAVDCARPPFEALRLENLGVTVTVGGDALELVSVGGTLAYDALRQCFGGADLLAAPAAVDTSP